ncbi:MAG: OB-fold nucleic acid binding domain-containing protein, partial [Gammaproteobacteria bacterium]
MSDDNNISTEGIIEERRKKLELLREENRAYLNNFSKNNNASEIHKSYESLSKEELEADPVEGLTIAGRVVLRRIMGNASFATIRDTSGDIQIYFSKQSISEEKYNDFKTWDLGDIIGIEGKLFRTRTGELTIEASEVILLTKAIRPMPDKFKGLADIEIKYRQRYLDLMSSQDTQKVFLDRSLIIDSIRLSLKSRNFMEVETPMMHPIPG